MEIVDLQSVFPPRSRGKAENRYSWAIGPILRSLTTNLVFARFILTDELTPAFNVSDLIGCMFVSPSYFLYAAGK